ETPGNRCLALFHACGVVWTGIVHIRIANCQVSIANCKFDAGTRLPNLEFAFLNLQFVMVRISLRLLGCGPQAAVHPWICDLFGPWCLGFGASPRPKLLALKRSPRQRRLMVRAAGSYCSRISARSQCSRSSGMS